MYKSIYVIILNQRIVEVKKLTTIGLVRHGETEWNRLGKIQGKTDIPLNEAGRSQAKKCSKLVTKRKWDLIITSPLQRAKETAEIMNQRMQLPMVVMDTFEERDYGDAEGMTRVKREASFPNRNYPNMETRDALIKRVEDGLTHVETAYPNSNVLLVSHGGVINTILSMLSEGEIGSGKTKLLNGCISNIFLESMTWKIKDYNQVSHLI